MNLAVDLTDHTKKKDWYSMPVEGVLVEVRSELGGLRNSEAVERLKANGQNELIGAKRIDLLKTIASQFKSILIWLLITASIVSWVLGERIDSVAILSIVLLNAIIGFYQEFSAEKSIAALRKITAPKAKVHRDGKVVSVSASQVVVGDILELEAGDLVAADARLIVTAFLQSIEANLTGESKAVAKHHDTISQADLPLADTANMVFMGTSVAAGTGKAVVVATGMQSELGEIASLIVNASADAKTPLQKKLDSFGQFLVWTTLGIVALLFGLGLLRGTAPFELFMGSISLAVAAVPEGLPAIVTVALALGVSRLARRGALVRKLPAVETLGSTTVICTDKTGTLTVGDMTVRALYVANKKYEVTGEGYGPDGVVSVDGKSSNVYLDKALSTLTSIHLCCNNSHLASDGRIWKTVGDPTEGALLALGIKAGGDQKGLTSVLPKRYEFPFDSNRKRSSVVREIEGGKLRAYVNGAPGVLLEQCTNLYTTTGLRALTGSDREQILEQTSMMANNALRVIASAYRDLPEAIQRNISAETVEQDLTFVGLAGMYDPPRATAKAAIQMCKLAGIRVVMITGDHPKTALAIGRELEISSTELEVVTGVELDKLSDADLELRVLSVAVYARVTAKHKLRIVRAFKAVGAVVAMTGDGVNDAPAIKGADIGIAMGESGTEVTKQAADMIITDDNFATIVVAVEEGRGIYDNIRKSLQYLLAGNTGELLLMTFCVIGDLPTPLLPIHLLWINLVTDGLPALCLATDSVDADLMQRLPRPRSELITNRSFLFSMFFTGFLTAGVSFSVYIYALKTETPEIARTAAFSVLVFSELLRSFGARSETKPIWSISLFTNTNLLFVVTISIAIQFMSLQNDVLGSLLRTERISYFNGLLLIAIGAIPLLGLEAAKLLRRSS